MSATLRSAVAAPAAVSTRRSVAANAASRPLWAPGKELKSLSKGIGGASCLIESLFFYQLPSLSFFDLLSPSLSLILSTSSHLLLAPAAPRSLSQFQPINHLAGVAPPAYLNGTLPGDRGFDPMGLGADPKALAW